MLDIRTVVVLLLVSSLLMILTLAPTARAGSSNGIRKWTLGLLLAALAWLLLAFRAELPPILGIALADAMMVASLSFCVVALAEFADRPVPRWLHWAPAAALFLPLAVWHDEYRVVTALGTLGIGSALFWVAFYVHRLGRSVGGSARWMISAVHFSAGTVLLARGVGVWVDPGAYLDVFARNLVQSVAFVIFFVLQIVSSFAFLVMLRDRREAQILELAMHDGLTGLFNRRAFLEIGDRELARASRVRSRLSLLMLDIDHFKRVNDEFGHPAGDRVLAALAGVMRQCVRRGDSVGRYGGEEFCVLLPDSDLAHALEAGERIRTVTAGEPLGDLPEAVTVSVGAAEWTAGETLAQVMARADRALYAAKQGGRNRVEGAAA